MRTSKDSPGRAQSASSLSDRPLPDLRAAPGVADEHEAAGRAFEEPEPRPALERSAGLDEQLCFALYAATNAVVRAYRPLLRAAGLTYPQYVVLMALWESADTSVTDLSARVRMPPSDLAAILDRLVDAELVQRHRHHLNRRTVMFALTDRGRLMEERAVTAQHQVRCQTRLSTGAVEQLRGSLHNLTDTLDSHHLNRAADADVIAS